MSENRPINEVAVDRREEKVVSQQPGQVSSQQVTRDVAAEGRLGLLQLTNIIWTLLSLLEIPLALRFALKLIAANPKSGLTTFIYGITEPFLAPFKALVGTPASGGSSFEATTLIAMAVYALLFWIIVRVIRVLADRPSSRTVTSSISEKKP